MNRNKFKKIIAVIIFIAGTFYAQAQNPPHPNSGGQPDSGNTVVGGQQGGAPIGSGNIILFALAMAYAGGKRYRLQEEKTED